MIKVLHIAAQYLAAAGVSFLEKKEDDSHTNLAWSEEQHELSTWAFSEHGDQLALNYESLSLIWSNIKGDRKELFLDGTSHLEALKWIDDLAKEKLNKTYNYQLHYELPYPFPTDEYIYHNSNQVEINRISNLLNIGKQAFSETLVQQSLPSDIRVWPHHFDLGAFVVPNDEISIGFGLAIPDAAINDFYYYVSGYRGNTSIETKYFEQLSIGEWQTEAWKAGSLAAFEASKENATQFLNEAINTFRN